MVTFLSFLVLTTTLVMLLAIQKCCGLIKPGHIAAKGARSRLLQRSALFCSQPNYEDAILQWSKEPVPRWPDPTAKMGYAYDVTRSYLQDKGVPEADNSARYLLCDVANLGYRRTDFHNALEEGSAKNILSSEQLTMLAKHCLQRADRVPIQYIIGNWDFYGLTLECRPPVLIPRPETEELVERVLSSKVLDGCTQPEILDIGAGTGAIGIAMLAELPTGKARCTAIDINPVAVELAESNAKNALSASSSSCYECLHKSFDELISNGSYEKKFDIIISNPPYIPEDEMRELEPEVGDNEDRAALYGGEDGLDLVREIITHGHRLLRSSGPGELWMEVARRHPKMIEEWIKALEDQSERRGTEMPKFKFIEGMNDLSGNARFVRLRLR